MRNRCRKTTPRVQPITCPSNTNNIRLYYRFTTLWKRGKDSRGGSKGGRETSRYKASSGFCSATVRRDVSSCSSGCSHKQWAVYGSLKCRAHFSRVNLLCMKGAQHASCVAWNDTFTVSDWHNFTMSSNSNIGNWSNPERRAWCQTPLLPVSADIPAQYYIHICGWTEVWIICYHSNGCYLCLCGWKLGSKSRRGGEGSGN